MEGGAAPAGPRPGPRGAREALLRAGASYLATRRCAQRQFLVTSPDPRDVRGGGGGCGGRGAGRRAGGRGGDDRGVPGGARRGCSSLTVATIAATTARFRDAPTALNPTERLAAGGPMNVLPRRSLWHDGNTPASDEHAASRREVELRVADLWTRRVHDGLIDGKPWLREICLDVQPVDTLEHDRSGFLALVLRESLEIRVEIADVNNQLACG